MKNLNQNDSLIKRPISPHLAIYRIQISSTLSILHRISGIILFLGLFLLAWILSFLLISNFDDKYFYLANAKIVRLILIFFSYAFFFHLSTGVRHLIWDFGYLFSVKAINISGFCALIFSFILTFIFVYYFIW